MKTETKPKAIAIGDWVVYYGKIVKYRVGHMDVWLCKPFPEPDTVYFTKSRQGQIIPFGPLRRTHHTQDVYTAGGIHRKVTDIATNREDAKLITY